MLIQGPGILELMHGNALSTSPLFVYLLGVCIARSEDSAPGKRPDSRLNFRWSPHPVIHELKLYRAQSQTSQRFWRAEQKPTYSNGLFDLKQLDQACGERPNAWYEGKRVFYIKAGMAYLTNLGVPLYGEGMASK